MMDSVLLVIAVVILFYVWPTPKGEAVVDDEGWHPSRNYKLGMWGVRAPWR